MEEGSDIVEKKKGRGEVMSVEQDIVKEQLRNGQIVKKLRDECYRYKLEYSDMLRYLSDDDLIDIISNKEGLWLLFVARDIAPHVLSAMLVTIVELCKWRRKSVIAVAEGMERLKRNGIHVAKAKYGWYNPLRYVTMWKTYVLYSICRNVKWWE